MSEYNLFNRWRVKRKHFWLAVGLGITLLCIVPFGIFAIFTPRFGAVSDVANIGFAGGEAAYDYEQEIYDEEADSAEDAMEYKDDSSIAANTNTDQATASNGSAAITERLIIREGNITIAVEKTRQTRDQIEDIVSELAGQGAYVVSASENGRGENLEPYINMTIRVPVEHFSSVMDQIAEMGIEVAERYETSQDVTEEYVDVAGRIEAKEISIERLKQFMQDAEFTEDLLNAEEQLSQREAELEALKGRLNYLSESAALSRISISLTPYELYEPIDTSWKPAATFKRAVENLVDSLQDFANFMILFGISVLPWLVFFGLIVWGVVAIVRRRRRNKKTEQPNQTE